MHKDRSDHLLAGAVVHSLVAVCHGQARDAGWWTDLATGADLTCRFEPGRRDYPRNIGELLALVHSEISEALEGSRKGRMDEHLPHRPSLEVELADALIRICDMAGGLGLDLGGAVREKLAYNASRADHKPEHRRQEGGKAF